MNKVKCDMHMHSTCSDGKISPVELLKEGERQGLKFMSITDHNTIDAYTELLNEDIKSYFSGTFVNGVEMTVYLNGMSLHLLGYGWDYEKLKKCDFLDPEYYHRTMEKGLDILKNAANSIGMKMSPDLKIPRPTKAHHKVFYADVSQYKENEKFIEKYHMENTFSFCKEEVANPNSIFYIPAKETMPSFEAVAKGIHESGGKTVLAHAFGYNYDGYEVLKNAYETNMIDGVECYYFFHTQEQIDYLVNFCKNHNLLITGGTDCHEKNMFYKDKTFECQLGHIFVIDQDVMLDEEDLNKLNAKE